MGRTVIGPGTEDILLGSRAGNLLESGSRAFESGYRFNRFARDLHREGITIPAGVRAPIIEGLGGTVDNLDTRYGAVLGNIMRAQMYGPSVGINGLGRPGDGLLQTFFDGGHGGHWGAAAPYGTRWGAGGIAPGATGTPIDWAVDGVSRVAGWIGGIFERDNDPSRTVYRHGMSGAVRHPGAVYSVGGGMDDALALARAHNEEAYRQSFGRTRDAPRGAAESSGVVVQPGYDHFPEETVTAHEQPARNERAQTYVYSPEEREAVRREAIDAVRNQKQDLIQRPRIRDDNDRGLRSLRDDDSRFDVGKALGFGGEVDNKTDLTVGELGDLKAENPALHARYMDSQRTESAPSQEETAIENPAYEAALEAYRQSEAESGRNRPLVGGERTGTSAAPYEPSAGGAWSTREAYNRAAAGTATEPGAEPAPGNNPQLRFGGATITIGG